MNLNSFKKYLPGSLMMLLAAGFFIAGCSPEKKKDGAVVARFDGKTITSADFSAKVRVLPSDLQELVLSRRKDFVQDMMEEHFLEKEAKKRGIARDQDVKELIQQAQRKIIIAKLIELEIDRKISVQAGEVQRYYDSHREQFMTPLLVRASHILVKSREEAESILVQLKNGADFAKLAREKSTDSTAPRGGDLGFFQKRQLIPEFENVAFSLSPGETSDVFETAFGFHILQVTDRAEPKPRDFESVKTSVERQLLQEKRSQRYREFIDKLKQGSKIEIDEKNLNAI